MNDFAEVRHILKKADKILVIGHIQPDGDSIGSVLAMMHILEGANKTVTVLSQDRIPETFSFLPGIKGFITSKDVFPEDGMQTDKSRAIKKQLESSDLLIALDTSTLCRMGSSFVYLTELMPVLNIDHHISNERYGKVNYVDGISSTGEIIFQLAGYLGITINKAIAECLYTSIVMDTGCFRYSSTSDQTHMAVAQLIRCGADTAAINEYIFDEKPLKDILLLARILPRLKFSPDNKIAWLTVTREDFQVVGANEDNVSNLIDYTRCNRGVEIGILIREMQQGQYKVSFRSKRVDVNRLASLFGGGGHSKAAGCLLEGQRTLEDVEKEIIAAAIKFCCHFGAEKSKTTV